ncbi:MAG: glycyl-radical enzyme activating protein, partial [Tissierellia bacterium]|nr:glycyl-radical enzyme activating protein [Tissierellia bacterium]
DVNDSIDNIRKTASFVSENIANGKIEILPYHSLGNYKYDKLGLSKFKNEFETPTKEEVFNVKEIIKSYGIEIVDFK